MEIQRPDKPRAVKAHIRKVAPAPMPERLENNRGSRAAKTAAAREAAARRNAAMVSPTKPTGPKKPKGKPSARRTPVKAQKTVSREEINRKISTQTPSQRHKVKSSKKVGGSIKNLEIKRRVKSSKQSFHVKRKKNGIGKLLLARLALFFVIFAIMFSLVAGVFFMRLNADGAEEGKAYTLQLGEDLPEDTTEITAEEDKPVYVDIPKDCAKRYGNLYIPVSALADMCELTVTGTVDDLRYIPRGSVEQSVRFEVGTDIAYVNGVKIRMISPSFLSEGKLYIPLDFMLKYSKGLIINTDEVNRKITISRYVEGYDAETDSDVYAELNFGLYVTSPLTAIPEPTE